MKITKTFSTTAESYFNSILDSLKADYLRNTGKTLEQTDQILGLKYVTSIGNKSNQQAEIEITDFVINKRYQATINSNRGVQRITYSIEPLSLTEIRVTYEEMIEETDFFTKWNYKILSRLFKKSINQKMEAQLDFIYNKI